MHEHLAHRMPKRIELATGYLLRYYKTSPEGGPDAIVQYRTTTPFSNRKAARPEFLTAANVADRVHTSLSLPFFDGGEAPEAGDTYRERHGRRVYSRFLFRYSVAGSILRTSATSSTFL